MPDNEVADSSVRIQASPNVNYAVIITLLGACVGGVWFMATQAATNAGVAERLNRFERIITDRIAAADRRDEVRLASVAAIENRLTRIEAQLTYLVTNGPKR